MNAAHELSQPDRAGLHRHEFGPCRWWHVPELSVDAVPALASDAGVPSAVIDAMRATPARPQVICREGWRIWTLAPVAFQPATAQVLVGQLVVASDGAVVVTCTGPLESIGEELVARVADQPSGPLRDADAVVHAVFTELLDAAGRAVNALDDAVEDIEAEVFAPQRGNHAERIYRLKREVQQARRCVGSLPELLDIGAASPAERDVQVDHGAGASDLHVHARRIVELVAHADELLDSVLAAHHTRVTIQQNDDMRRISAWVAIVAAPTAIASIYGMNFRYMPELGSPWGYPAVLLLMLGICLTLYRLFRGSGWL